MTVAIVEDDEESASLLKGMLEKYGEKIGKMFTIRCFTNGVSFISDYSAEYNLVFMDIDMPHMNGMETAKLLRKLDKGVALVFVTNLKKYAIKGYEVCASDFIVKPLEYETFSAKMSRILQLVKTGSEPFLPVNTHIGKKKIFLSEIYYVTVSGRYVTLHTKSGDVQMRTSMKELEKQLTPHHFVRGDYSSMVNLAYVTAVGKDSVTVNGQSLPCSRTRRKALFDAFTLFLR